MRKCDIFVIIRQVLEFFGGMDHLFALLVLAAHSFKVHLFSGGTFVFSSHVVTIHISILLMY